MSNKKKKQADYIFHNLPPLDEKSDKSMRRLKDSFSFVPAADCLNQFRNNIANPQIIAPSGNIAKRNQFLATYRRQSDNAIVQALLGNPLRIILGLQKVVLLRPIKGLGTWVHHQGKKLCGIGIEPQRQR